ncbi:MAG: 2-amino-4-hydroxy-6-hydroxymethyldihydropteridine diphosphokinase [Bacteroidales bacterium]|nr:2-amino-4-hydroxy-6-hydroxymethyldihydropteridine diphosphokinase [Bacteroidales bacterium]
MIYLLLGTDMGDREANLSRARELLAKELGKLKCSQVMETEAIGFEGPAFLNQVVAFDGDFEPYDLLRRCQAVEVAMGRPAHKARYDADGRRVYEPRIIDVDILHLNGIVMDEPELTIPHPQVFSRPFVQALMQLVHKKTE